jgi:hypothetical protein
VEGKDRGQVEGLEGRSRGVDLCCRSVSPNEINKHLELTQSLYYSSTMTTKTPSDGWKSNAPQHRACSISPHTWASLPSSKLQRHPGTRRVDIRNEGSIFNAKSEGTRAANALGIHGTDVVEACTTSKTAKIRTRTYAHIGVTSIPHQHPPTWRPGRSSSSQIRMCYSSISWGLARSL